MLLKVELDSGCPLENSRVFGVGVMRVRIIAGEWKGLRLSAPAGAVARPTTDRVKESMFNLMGIDWPGGAAVDLFAGSGALGLEALSRGAPRAYLIDVSPVSLRAIRENVDRARSQARVQLWRMDWSAGWQRISSSGEQVAWVFVDPPYAMRLWEQVLQTIAVNPGGLTAGVVCEHPVEEVLKDRYECLVRFKSKRYGDIAISLYRRENVGELGNP